MAQDNTKSGGYQLQEDCFISRFPGKTFTQVTRPISVTCKFFITFWEGDFQAEVVSYHRVEGGYRSHVEAVVEHLLQQAVAKVVRS